MKCEGTLNICQPVTLGHSSKGFFDRERSFEHLRLEILSNLGSQIFLLITYVLFQEYILGD